MKNKLVIIGLIIGLIFIGFKIFGNGEDLTQINENIEIVIDPGHGGEDPGTEGINGRYEKDINLEIAEKLYFELQKKGYGASLTRKDDRYLKHMERVDHSNNNSARIFVSIHCNATENDESINGLQVLYFPSQSSKDLAGIMQRNIIEEVGMNDLGTVERSDLIVLNQTTMPAVIVESGFLSNPRESKQLERNSYQKKIVRGITKAIEEYYNIQGW